MLNLAIEGTTRRIGKSQGYRGLCVRDVVLPTGTPAMATAWQPTPAELERLNAGAPLHLIILGVSHPPVILEVGQPPPSDNSDPLSPSAAIG